MSARRCELENGKKRHGEVRVDAVRKLQVVVVLRKRVK